MTWNDAVFAVRYTDARRLALLMSVMWREAARNGDEALLSNLQINTMDALGVANSLDWAGVPVPPQAREAIGLMDGPGSLEPRHAARVISFGPTEDPPSR
jgi:hypothetical protein